MNHLLFLTSRLRPALVAVLAMVLALAGAQRSDTVRTAHAPLTVAAQDAVVPSIILTAHSQLMRMHLPDGDTSRADLLLPENPTALAPAATRMVLQRDARRGVGNVHIRPRVRGPPAV